VTPNAEESRVSQALAQLRAATSDEAMTAAAQALADVSLDALHAWVTSHQPAGHPRVHAAADVLTARLAVQQPEAAVRWVWTETAPGWRADYASQTAHVLAGTRADLTMQLLPAVTNVIARRDVLGVAFAALAQSNPDEGKRLALAATDESVRAEAVTTWLVNRVDDDLAGSVELVNDAQLDDAATQQCLAAVARAVAVRDGRRAASWVDALDPGLRTAVMVNTVAAAWGQQDPGAAQNWLSQYDALVKAAPASSPQPERLY
jgi:hypothetical protein